jgi:predicted kinase
MKKTLVIFSGLPGTGKTTLAQLLAQRLGIPLLRIDDIVSSIPLHMSHHSDPFWEDMISILLNLVDCQLKQGFSVVVDSVFMGDDRYQAYELSARHAAVFRPIYTYLSDEGIWQERVRRRVEAAAPEIRDLVATWDRIQQQSKGFHPWRLGSALVVDAVNSVETNFNEVLRYVTKAELELASP